MARATRSFLEAAGLDPRSADLRETPRRVAEAWCESFLDGYDKDAQEILEETIASEGSEPVVVRAIAFHSMCPHHLLPFAGVAEVAYVPGARAVGFSRVVELVDAFAHRLSLQERIAREVAQALTRHLGAKAAACGIEAEHACMTLRGPRRRGTRVWVEAFAGARRWKSRLAALIRPPRARRS